MTTSFTFYSQGSQVLVMWHRFPRCTEPFGSQNDGSIRGSSREQEPRDGSTYQLGKAISTVDGSEIQPSQVEVGSLSHYFAEFYTAQVVVWDFFHQQYVEEHPEHFKRYFPRFNSQSTNMFFSYSRIK